MNFLSEIHTNVVHFPIALLSTYAILEIVGMLFNKEFLSKSAFLILCLGVISAFFAVLTGNEAFGSFKFWTEESSALLNEHQTYATALLWFSVLICGLRVFLTAKKKFKGNIKYLFILFGLVMLFLVYQTGLHGGQLVKKYGIGTDFIKSDE